MALNTVAVTQTPNTVSLTPTITTVTPQIVTNTVSVNGQGTQVQVPTQNVTLTAVQNPVTVTVQAVTIGVVTAAIQGPAGVSDEVILLTKATRRDVVEDVPSPGDITIYDGVAQIGTANSAAAWLISRQIFTADGDAFDTSKTFASSGEDQVWDNRLFLTYT